MGKQVLQRQSNQPSGVLLQQLCKEFAVLLLSGSGETQRQLDNQAAQTAQSSQTIPITIITLSLACFIPAIVRLVVSQLEDISQVHDLI